MRIIIPMSGVGKRFVDAGYSEPKPLIMVEGKPIIQHVVELFPEEHDIVFICNDHHLETTNMIDTLYEIAPKCRVYSVSVNDRKGPVDAVLQIADKELIGYTGGIIISYCDYGTLWNYSQFKSEVERRGIDGAIPCYRGFHPHMLGGDNYAFVKVAENDNSILVPFLEIQEKKPFTSNKMQEYASNGTYYFRTGDIAHTYFTKLVERNISINGEFYVSMVYNLMHEAGLKIGVFQIEKMLQWGTPRDLEEYLVWSDYFRNRNREFLDGIKDQHNTLLVLPMAGAGSRFFNEGYSLPKPLLPIEGEPMIVKAVECLPPTIEKTFICQRAHLEQYPIADALKTKYPESHFILIDKVTEGQACTCEYALREQKYNHNGHVLISACDNGVYYDIDKYMALVEDPNVDIVIWCFSNNPTSKLYPHMYAWLDVDDENRIRRVSVKKPFTDVDNKYAIIGTMLFKSREMFLKGLDYIYTNNLRTNGEFYVDNMIEPLVNMGYCCKIFNVDNYLCWGTPNDYKTYDYWQKYHDHHI